ncbi:DUF4214 domain-containing protein [Thalassotalea montiporae]
MEKVHNILELQASLFSSKAIPVDKKFIHFSQSDFSLFSDGFHQSEGTFRWTEKTCKVNFSVAKAHMLKFKLSTYLDENLAEIKLNGVTAKSVKLVSNNWVDIELNINPSSLGCKTVELQLLFEKAQKPSEVGLTDMRELGGCVSDFHFEKLNIYSQKLKRPVRNVAMPPGETVDINMIQQFHDFDFINVSYNALLGREPDPVGRDYYLNKLRSGEYSKPEILALLKYSREGKLVNKKIKGNLFPFFALLAIQRVPLFGSGVRWAVSVLKLATYVKSIQRMDASMQYYNHSNNECVDSIIEYIETEEELN